MHFSPFRQYSSLYFIQMGKKNFQTGHLIDKDSLLRPFPVMPQLPAAVNPRFTCFPAIWYNTARKQRKMLRHGGNAYDERQIAP